MGLRVRRWRGISPPPRSCGLCGVHGGGGGEGASVRGPPLQHTWFRLIQLPPLGLLAPMMMPAQRGDSAFAGEPALVPGEGVVQVAPGRGPAAAGRGAPGAAGADQVLELAAGLVPGLGVTVITPATGDQGQPYPQRQQVVPGPGTGRRPLVWAGWFGAGWFRAG